jgi:hypothetical protein
MSPTVKGTASVVRGRSCWMRDTGSCDTVSVAKTVSAAGGHCSAVHIRQEAAASGLTHLMISVIDLAQLLGYP